MIDITNYNGPIRFGDLKLIEAIKAKKKRKLETTQITIDLKKLIKAGVERSVALNLLERLISIKK